MTDAYSRRSVLAGAGAALGTLAVGTGAADARAETKAVVAEGDETENDLTGFFVHVGPTTSPIDAQVAAGCAFADWSDDATTAYDVTLVDRAEPEYARYERTAYVPDSVQLPPGSLFVVNSQERCTEGYVGVRLLQIGSDRLEAAASGDVPDRTAADGTGASGPGFGVLAALGGLVGWGALERRRE
ncbi:hypothetical protein [Haloarcula litorea]|uniref:hypothetical protein n=1 Tax=Haloarcula litorea TaxID=3032579 RepID=UPI0023E87FA1|nr:hypothetical protein [Halomicroarcula sp. GDY20]